MSGCFGASIRGKTEERERRRCAANPALEDCAMMRGGVPTRYRCVGIAACDAARLPLPQEERNHAARVCFKPSVPDCGERYAIKSTSELTPEYVDDELESAE